MDSKYIKWLRQRPLKAGSFLIKRRSLYVLSWALIINFREAYTINKILFKTKARRNTLVSYWTSPYSLLFAGDYIHFVRLVWVICFFSLSCLKSNTPFWRPASFLGRASLKTFVPWKIQGNFLCWRIAPHSTLCYANSFSITCPQTLRTSL